MVAGEFVRIAWCQNTGAPALAHPDLDRCFSPNSFSNLSGHSCEVAIGETCVGAHLLSAVFHRNALGTLMLPIHYRNRDLGRVLVCPALGQGHPMTTADPIAPNCLNEAPQVHHIT